ncbi:MAG: hypothetical protein OXN84_13645 [Albidovulum sp.]|nr:hypothetical protein [Albidovulum sp.]
MPNMRRVGEDDALASLKAVHDPLVELEEASPGRSSAKLGMGCRLTKTKLRRRTGLHAPCRE